MPSIDSCEEIVIKEQIIGGEDGQPGIPGPPGASLTELEAEKVTVTNNGYNNAQEIFDFLLYVSPIINFFNTSPTLFLNRLSAHPSADFTIPFSWSLNKAAATLTLVGPAEMTPVTLLLSEITKTVTMTNFNTGGTFTLTFGDGTSNLGNTVVKNVTVAFTNKLFYGDSPIGTSDGSFIEGLSNSNLQTNNNRGITGSTTTTNTYFWFATPTAYGLPGMTVGGFVVDLTLEATFNYTNALGHEEEYKLYRTTNDNLGSINIDIT